LIIDCHGHYTTEPVGLKSFREAQIAHFDDGSKPAPVLGTITDDDIRESIENNQLKAQRDRGADMTIFSPRASGMAHHMIGCNLNPDPTGGWWTDKPLTDKVWYPFFEKMVELNVPAMIHVSGSCNSNFHATGAHYLNADTTAFMQFLQGDLFSDFPELKLIIPHGGGAVPYHWGRFRGLADMLGKPPLTEHIMKNVYFDTCVYHQAGIDCLFKVVDIENILFASEMFGAVKGVDPETGHNFDDTKRYIDNLMLGGDDRAKVFELNARRVYPRLDLALADRGA